LLLPARQTWRSCFPGDPVYRPPALGAVFRCFRPQHPRHGDRGVQYALRRFLGRYDEARRCVAPGLHGHGQRSAHAMPQCWPVLRVAASPLCSQGIVLMKLAKLTIHTENSCLQHAISRKLPFQRYPKLPDGSGARGTWTPATTGEARVTALGLPRPSAGVAGTNYRRTRHVAARRAAR